MPRTWSTNATLQRNAIDGGDPFCFLFRLTIAGAPGQIRLTDNNEVIVFHGLVFDPFQIQLEPLSESSDGSLQRFRVTFSNVDQQFASLVETYWIAGLAEWKVEIWHILAVTPNEVPLTVKEEFDVMAIATDLLTAVAELQAAELNLSTYLPLRRFTPSHGFTKIPRVQ